MSISSYLQRRGKKGIFHFRMRVPRDIQEHITGKPRELTKSLKTSNLEEALPLARQLLQQAKQAFSEIETRAGVSNKDIVLKISTLTGKKKLKPVANPMSNIAIDSRLSIASKGLKLKTLVEKYCRHHLKTKKTWRESTEKDNQAIFKIMLEILGNVDVKSIDRMVAIDYQEKILALPKGINQNPDYRNKSIKQILAGKPEQMSRRTADKYLVQTSSLFKWAFENDFIEKYPFAKISLGKGKYEGGKKRVPFSEVELSRLFTTERFTKHDFECDWQFWVPILLLQGFRLAEVTGLRCEDVRVMEGSWVIIIKPNDKRLLKNVSAERVVCVHKYLEHKLDFDEFMTERRLSGDEYLFPELKFVKRRGKWDNTRSVSNWFNGTATMKSYKEKCGITIQENKKKDIHSFRHTTLNEFQSLGKEVSPILVQYIVGHHQKEYDLTFSKYGDEEFRVSLISETVNKLKFDKVLNHVKPWKSREK